MTVGKILTYFMPQVSKLPDSIRKTRYFLMFSVGIEIDQCHEMGEIKLLKPVFVLLLRSNLSKMTPS